MRDISREVLARDAAWDLADGDCKDLTTSWSAWENAYATSRSPDRDLLLANAALVCRACPITRGCADLAELSEYTGIAAGSWYRDGHRHHARQPAHQRPVRESA